MCVCSTSQVYVYIHIVNVYVCLRVYSRSSLSYKPLYVVPERSGEIRGCVRSSNIQYSVLILFDVVTRKQDTNERRILVYCLRLEKDERGKYEFYVFPKKK